MGLATRSQHERGVRETRNGDIPSSSSVSTVSDVRASLNLLATMCSVCRDSSRKESSYRLKLQAKATMLVRNEE